MKVMVDAGVSCIRGSRKPFAVAGSSVACSKEALSRCVCVDSTDKDGIVDGWRPGTARPLPRSLPPSGGVSVPSARISILQVIPMFYDAACEVITNSSHVLPTDG
jgi:hypothetical protein